MSERFSTHGANEPSGFFGAEQAQITEELDPGIWAEIDDFLERSPGGHERLIPLLHRIQETVGYLPFAIQEYVAEKLGLSPIQVYSVISFYHFFTTNPRGQHELKVCMGTACFVRHSQRLLKALEKELGVTIGEVTDDKLFSLEQVRCLGCCGLAPAMMVDSDTQGKLNPKKVLKVVHDLQGRAQGNSEK